jgi:flagellar L-ring protein precursor FlgH
MSSNRPLAAVVLGLAVVSMAGPASADSLYPAGKYRNMFTDRKARAVGDVVTVLITESTVASEAAASDAQRSLNANARGGTGLFGLFKLVPKATLGGDTQHKGSGSTSRSSRLTTTITCKVVEITPAGQLVLQGERSLKINADTQTIQFHGIARPEDVDPDNTILSSSVADAQIAVAGKGPIDQHVKTGILSRLFRFLF